MEKIARVFESYAVSENEAQTEEGPALPILRALGHDFEVQPALTTPDGTKRPDYVFYRDAVSLCANKNRTLNEDTGLPYRSADLSSRWSRRIPLYKISVQKYPHARGRSLEGPRPDRQSPQRTWLLSRARIAMDEASIYRIEAILGCVRQYSDRRSLANFQRSKPRRIPASCIASPSVA